MTGIRHLGALFPVAFKFSQRLTQIIIDYLLALQEFWRLALGLQGLWLGWQRYIIAFHILQQTSLTSMLRGLVYRPSWENGRS